MNLRPLLPWNWLEAKIHLFSKKEKKTSIAFKRLFSMNEFTLIWMFASKRELNSTVQLRPAKERYYSSRKKKVVPCLNSTDCDAVVADSAFTNALYIETTRTKPSD